MPSFSVHPTTRLCFWLALLLIVQILSGKQLVLVLPLVFVMLTVMGRSILKRGIRLIWRARWLLLSLFVILAWGIAGDPVWDGAMAPTHEGLIEALTHLGRLVLVLTVVAALLETLPLADLLAATHSLLSPLRHFGLDADRGVVRLMLVLRYVETLPRPRDWSSLLDVPVASASERVEVNDHALRGLDYALAVVIIAMLALACYY
jgi:energy-coupling factor transporter transmembrane protein EcfT